MVNAVLDFISSRLDRFADWLDGQAECDYHSGSCNCEPCFRGRTEAERREDEWWDGIL